MSTQQEAEEFMEAVRADGGEVFAVVHVPGHVDPSAHQWVVVFTPRSQGEACES